jgi:hypothetical protein
MSKERELLERWLDDTIFEPEELDSLMEETRELLAQPEQEQEPLSGKWWYGKGVEDTKFFLKRPPLTRQQISEGNQSMFNVTREAFVKGIKFAEKAHGIGGDDENDTQHTN